MLFKRPTAEERIAEHRRIHARGMGLFILFDGILGFGTFTFLIDVAVSALFEHRRIDFEFVIAKVLQWSAAGLLFGWLMWRIEYAADEDKS
jgi:hypothetical protein